MLHWYDQQRQIQRHGEGWILWGLAFLFFLLVGVTPEGDVDKFGEALIVSSFTLTAYHFLAWRRLTRMVKRAKARDREIFG